MAKYFPKNVTINEATMLQSQFAQDVILRDDFPVDLKTIGGAVLNSRGEAIKASIALFKLEHGLEKLKLIKKDVSSENVAFPALPSFEGFREGKVLSNLITKFDIPDIFLIKGHGINHPRRFGIASHVGVSLNLSTIGVETSLLCGKVERREGEELIIENEEVLGKIVKKDQKALPLCVSPGNKVTIGTAVEIVQKCMRKGPLPEPLQVAQDNLIKS